MRFFSKFAVAIEYPFYRSLHSRVQVESELAVTERLKIFVELFRIFSFAPLPQAHAVSVFL
jgi:hypothetical protein